MATDPLERGRAAFDQRAWRAAHTSLAVANQETPLAAEDLERLAVAAHLIGRDDEAEDSWARAHLAWLDRGDPPRAVRCAFWLAFGLANRGEGARAGGWLGRAGSLLEGRGTACLEQGYLLLAAARRSLAAGNALEAQAAANRAGAIADRFGDRDLAALTRLMRGRALLRLGRVDDGLPLLDEVMVAVTTGEILPIGVGPMYCGVIEACHEVGDLRRAREWTAALDRWAESQPELVPYRGQCLVYRAELKLRHGDWQSALSEARRACESLSGPSDQAIAAAAHYQQAELHRLRGELGAAEEAYREASRRGRDPQPGLALLRVAQGRHADAVAAIRRVVADARDRVGRPIALAAQAEIMLAAGDPAAAHAAADELAAVATELGTPLARAMAAHAGGAISLAERDARAALEALHQALVAWRELEAPYQVARVRVLIGRAYRELQDLDTAAMELDAARALFRQLGAAPDLASVEALIGSDASATGGLSPRELEVLRLVSAGKSNRAIAAELVVSERTIDRHVSNIFDKLGLSSRAAATAYAYEHKLV